MAEFTLEPDQPTADRPERRAPPRMVATGLAPTAEMPHARGKGKEGSLAYAPCKACGQPVLMGETRTGSRLALDVHAVTYAVSWDKGTRLPRLERSRGYPVHGCHDQPHHG